MDLGQRAGGEKGGWSCSWSELFAASALELGDELLGIAERREEVDLAGFRAFGEALGAVCRFAGSDIPLGFWRLRLLEVDENRTLRLMDPTLGEGLPVHLRVEKK